MKTIVSTELGTSFLGANPQSSYVRLVDFGYYVSCLKVIDYAVVSITEISERRAWQGAKWSNHGWVLFHFSRKEVKPLFRLAEDSYSLTEARGLVW